MVSRRNKSSTEYLTTRNHNPYEVHEEKVKPEIIGFRSAISQILVVVIEHARSIVEDIAIYLAK